MCGIGGVYPLDGAASRRALEHMNDRQSHRGPDEAGTAGVGAVGLAHRRLSIVDLDAGEQPIYNEDRSVSVVFNGEIYNYRALRESLVDAGHEFTTRTDTEVLVHLYEEEGVSLVERLRGMFAFGLVDRDAGRLLLARDPVGIKPLYVGQAGERLQFASELHALLSGPFDHGGLDRDAFVQYFLFGYVPAPKTPFRNVRELPPGHVGVFEDGTFETERYYRASAAAPPDTYEAAVDGVRERLTRAVERRLVGDVPVGAFLSGGVDSSAIVAVLSELVDEPVRTFTVGFEDALFDESSAARTVAEHCGTEHAEHVVRPEDVLEVVPDVVDALGEPFADPSLIPTYVVAERTSRDVTVALSGDGADELFAGYDYYRAEFLSRYYRRLPSASRSLIERVVDRLPAHRSSRLGELGWMADEFVQTAGEEPTADRHLGWLRRDSGCAGEAFEADDVAAVAAELAAKHDRAETALDRPSDESVQQMQFVDLRYGLPNGILTKVDRASMLNSLEARVPFLDRDLVEYALGLPPEYAMTASRRKRVLEDAVAPLLPDATLERSKQGFDLPIGAWLTDELRPELEAAIDRVDGTVVDAAPIRAALREHAAGRRNHERLLWSTFVLAHWLDAMVDRGVLDV